jgi:hypothetical protein
MTLARAFRPGTFTGYRVIGGIAGYLLIGYTSAYAYQLLLQFVPGAIHFEPGLAFSLYRQPEHLIYFSFTTPTTVGYGDIHSAHPARKSSKPRPGQPWANVKNRRRRRSLRQRLRWKNANKAPKGCLGSLVQVYGFDDSALEPYHGRVGAILRAQLGKDVFDSSLNSFLGHGELRCNLLIGIPGGNQPSDIGFRRRQSLIGGMLDKLLRGLGGKRLPPGMDRAYSPQSSLSRRFFSRYARAPTCVERRTWTSPR